MMHTYTGTFLIMVFLVFGVGGGYFWQPGCSSNLKRRARSSRLGPGFWHALFLVLLPLAATQCACSVSQASLLDVVILRSP